MNWMKKKCILCHKRKSKKEFYNQKKAKDGKSPYCKVCSYVKTKEYVVRNKNRNRSLTAEEILSLVLTVQHQ